MGKGQNNIVDVSLPELQKQKIRINGDDSKIIEINLSDMGVIDRLKQVYDKLTHLANEYHLDKEEAAESDNEEGIDDADKVVEQLSQIDAEMRKLIDFAFNANVADICAEDGTMADPINGQFRFEYIIEKFLELYDTNFTAEFKKMSAKVGKHTNKYTRK